MSEMIIVEPFALSYGGAAPSFLNSRGIDAGNLIELDPREVWVDNVGTGTYWFDIDLGAAMDWDTIALFNVSALAGASWTITGGASLLATTYLANSTMRLNSEDGIAIASSPALFVSPTVINGRFVRITVTPNGGPLNSIGCLIIGKSWKPSLPREYGAGRPPLDTGSRTRLDGGGLATVPGVLTSGFKWVFADLEDADLAKLWGIMRRRRTTEPVVLVEDPAAPTAESVHYCTLVELEAYERRQASKSRWALSVEDWI